MNESPAIRLITNAEVVVQHFGCWPSFHDAEIKRVTFDANPGYYPAVTFLIVAFETTKLTDERGYFRQAKQCEIELRFTGIKKIDFDGFSHQNVILKIEFDEQDGDFTCTIDSSVGLDAYIIAQGAEVISLTPTTTSHPS